MFSQSLKEASEHLSGASLQSFIVDVTSEGQNYSFSDLLDHPKINTVRPQFIVMLKLFANGSLSYNTMESQQHPELTQKQISTLRKLTILSEFFGEHTIQISTLAKKLRCSQQEVISILVKMNIEGRVSIKIDEENGVITIIDAELRKVPLQGTRFRAVNASIQSIQRRNQFVKKQLGWIQGNGKPKINQPQESWR